MLRKQAVLPMRLASHICHDEETRTCTYIRTGYCCRVPLSQADQAGGAQCHSAMMWRRSCPMSVVALVGVLIRHPDKLVRACCAVQHVAFSEPDRPARLKGAADGSACALLRAHESRRRGMGSDFKCAAPLPSAAAQVMNGTGPWATSLTSWRCRSESLLHYRRTSGFIRLVPPPASCSRLSISPNL